MSDGRDRLEPGQPAPEFTERTTRGDVLSLAVLRGKVVLINIAATYCPMCRAELPDLKAIYTRTANQGFEIVTVWLDAEPAAVAAAVAKNELQWPQIVTGGDMTRGIPSDYAVYGTPTNYLIDREGKLIRGNIPMNELTSAIAAALSIAPPSNP
jgi:peroxiredoxin